tara:strand:- start:7596 stop:7871 length:276 start_codon:yes stop_codon:yes gene_type:complete
MKKWTNGTYQDKSNTANRSNTLNTLNKTNEKRIGNRIFLIQESKKEDIITRMETRELFTNKTINPYMMGNSYLKDLEVQEEFLKPQNSNFK